MKKVGILTFHDGINYGAFLQVYCLYHTIRDMGFMVEVINYKNITHWLKEWAYFLLTTKSIANMRKIAKFRRSQGILQQSDFAFKIQKIIAKKAYDFIVVGSDEVWNVNNCMFGFDPVYFGVNCSSRWISYAPSFGSTNLDDNTLARIKSAINRFDNISVRDENSARIVELLTDHLPHIVPDPTLLRETPELEIDPEIEYQYCLVYSAKHFSINERNEIIAFAQQNDKKLVSVGAERDWCFASISDAGVGEWLGLYKHADFIFTTMFHGTLFSIKYNKPFCLFLDPYRRNKFYPILSLLSLEGRLYNKGCLKDILSCDIDYETVSNRLYSFKLKGISILKNFLS